MPTFMPISSYSLILILNVGESVGKSPPVMALDMFPIAFGRFFIKSSGDVVVYFKAINYLVLTKPAKSPNPKSLLTGIPSV